MTNNEAEKLQLEIEEMLRKAEDVGSEVTGGGHGATIAVVTCAAIAVVARYRAKNAELRSALESTQWGLADYMGDQRVCPECEGADPEQTTTGDWRGHRPDCSIAKALTE